MQRCWESGSLRKSMEARHTFPHTLPHVSLSSGQSSTSSYYFHDKLVNMLPWVLWAILANYWTQGGDHGNHDLLPVDQKYRWQPGTWNWHLKMDSGATAVFWDWTLIWDVWGNKCQYWVNRRTLSWCHREKERGQNPWMNGLWGHDNMPATFLYISQTERQWTYYTWTFFLPMEK